MSNMTKEELKKAVETYTNAEIAYLNKMFEGICSFELVKDENIFSDMYMKNLVSCPSVSDI